MAYFGSGFFGANYYLEGFFGNGITVPIPPAPAVAAPIGVFRKKKLKPKVNRKTLTAIRDYLTWKLSP
jgi:hypothetical protein